MGGDSSPALLGDIMRLIATIICLVFLSGCAFVKTRDPWTKTDKICAVASIIAVAADGHSTIRMLDNPNNYEMNPIMGSRPSDGRVVGTMLATQVFYLFFCHLLPSEYREVFLGGKTILNTGWAIHNYQMER